MLACAPHSGIFYHHNIVDATMFTESTRSVEQRPDDVLSSMIVSATINLTEMMQKLAVVAVQHDS